MTTNVENPNEFVNRRLIDMPTNLDKMLDEARFDTAKRIDAVLEEMEKEPHTEKGKEDSYDIGYLTALRRARAKIKEIFKVD